MEKTQRTKVNGPQTSRQIETNTCFLLCAARVSVLLSADWRLLAAAFLPLILMTATATSFMMTSFKFCLESVVSPVADRNEALVGVLVAEAVVSFFLGVTLAAAPSPSASTDGVPLLAVLGLLFKAEIDILCVIIFREEVDLAGGVFGQGLDLEDAVLVAETDLAGVVLEADVCLAGVDFRAEFGFAAVLLFAGS